jgi:NADH-quinone oxidoreductase subunit I
LVLLDDNQHLACVSCGLCEAACPAYAITIDGAETDRFIEREPKLFEIDMLRCILCGFCEEACPKDAIFMSAELELADFTRAALIYDIEKLKRPRAALQDRIDYYYGTNDRWRKPSSTS